MTQNPSPLPVRRSRTRRKGRHRSPHHLSLPSEAPVLVLAVPGPACSASAEIVAELATSARESSTGLAVRAGYLEGAEESLPEVLSALPEPRDEAPSAVVVPLIVGADPAVEGAAEAAVRGSGGRAVLADRLGAHPLVGDALHGRLAEAGLAQADRMRELNITSAGAPGILVITATGGEDAELTALILASRLAVPAAGAALDRPGSLDEALERLHTAGVSRPAVAPAVIGPELGAARVEEAVTRAGAAGGSAPLGGHAAIARLAVARYGAVLS